MRMLALLVGAALLAGAVVAQTPRQPDAHAKKDIERHRAMAKAHEEAARCLESGKEEAVCQGTAAALQRLGDRQVLRNEA
jgi:hypothetical protein